MAKAGSVLAEDKKLIYTGLVTSIPSVSGFAASGLANFGDHFFEGWSVYVSKKDDDSAAVPFREQQVVATYVSAAPTPGAFTLVLPFTATLAVGDEVYVIHPDIASAIGAIIPLLNAIKAETDLIPADVAAILALGALVKAETDQIGTVVNTGGTATLAALLGDMANNSAASRLTAIAAAIVTLLADLTVPAADAADNVLERDAIGNKSDAAVTAVGVVASIMAYVKGGLNQTNKLAGQAPVSNSVVANWQAAEQDLVSIGAAGIRNKVQTLFIDMNAIAGTLTIRMYHVVNGVQRQVYSQDFTVAADGPGRWTINGTVGIFDVLRVTCQSSLAGDNGAAIAYSYMLEAM